MDSIRYETKILELMDQYQNLILSVCYKLTQDYFAAQDLTQETFLSAYQHLNSFDGKNEKAWLCRIASNKCVDYLRQAQRKQIPTQREELELMQPGTGNSLTGNEPERQVLEKDVRQELLQNCGRLKPPYDEIAYQYFYLERTAEEIAVLQRKNKKTIQTQMYRAREMLRRIYRREAEAAKRNQSGTAPGEGNDDGKEWKDGF